LFGSRFIKIGPKEVSFQDKSNDKRKVKRDDEGKKERKTGGGKKPFLIGRDRRLKS
jgi:hypothetical protein